MNFPNVRAALTLSASVLMLLAAPTLTAAEWHDLITPNLEAWDKLGDGIWRVDQEGTLIGYRRPVTKTLFGDSDTITKKRFEDWRGVQSWLYTKKVYGEFDLHIEYRVRVSGNSGISLRDSSRAKFAITQPADYQSTPAHHGYEVQISGRSGSSLPSGSIYTFLAAKDGVQKDGEWNSFDIESRNDMIRVRLNGKLVTEFPGDPKRPKVGPIGLQLHDQFNSAMFRNIRIMEIAGTQ
ncbi:MAG: DUF1080 domain-containing protein [Acidobacteria bacterium]|nr:DUF1080 domain-containing protein [Acidobacteriota bacterium]